MFYGSKHRASLTIDALNTNWFESGYRDTIGNLIMSAGTKPLGTFSSPYYTDEKSGTRENESFLRVMQLLGGRGSPQGWIDWFPVQRSLRLTGPTQPCTSRTQLSVRDSESDRVGDGRSFGGVRWRGHCESESFHWGCSNNVPPPPGWLE